jgi:hypothetical protein
MYPEPQISPSNLKAQDAANEAQIWEAGARKYEDTEDIFTSMEGGQDALIETVTRTSAGVGHQITFRQRSGFHGEGKLDEEDFDDDDDFEEALMSTDTLRVGFMRNGMTSWFLTSDELGYGTEIEAEYNEELGKWLGREKTWQMTQSLIHQTKQDNHIPVDALSLESVSSATAQMRPLGGSPAYLNKDQHGNHIWGLCYITPTEGMAVLDEDPEYVDRLKTAGVRGGNNPLFTGESVMLKGNLIKHWDVKDHDGEGAIGSPLNPKAYLGVAIAAGTGVLEITGGGSPSAAAKLKKKYFRFFPAYNFKFAGGGSVAVNAFSHHLTNVSGNLRFYVTIVNPRSATTDPGKWCIYECSVNDGNRLTVTRRLGPTNAGGTQVSTLGAVTWDAAKNSQTHPVGSLVYWSYDTGVPSGRTIGMGKGAARRGYGAFRSKRFYQKIQGGIKTETYIGSVFGQRPRVDRIKRNPAVIVLRHPIKYDGWDHPTP